jgi:hypothetical protein
MLKGALKDLGRSAISKSEAVTAGMFSVKDATEIYEDFLPYPALVIPYFETSGEVMSFEQKGKKVPFCRVRYLESPKAKAGFTVKKAQRYGQPKASGCRAYFPVTDVIDWERIIEDTDIPIVITEGEKKALRGCLSGLPTIGLGGVYNFMSDGSFLPELSRINWEKRPVYICFDSDAVDNPNIQAAEGRLATEISVNRKGHVFVVRVPEIAAGQKAGLDDYIAARGDDKVMELFEKAKPLRKIDNAVISLNEHVAWVESEGQVYDLHSKQFMRKDAFVSGSKYSPLELITVGKKGSVKRVSVAQEWLRHPHATRYDDIVFSPDTTERVVVTEKGRTLNMWQGWSPSEPGDVRPFLDLHNYIFSEMDEESRELPLKLLAYKAQNPGKKIPLALVLVGTGQGSGKSLWASCVQEAFYPYGVEVAPEAIASQFNGWMERALLAVFNEVEPDDIRGTNAGKLRRIISEKRQHMNEKHRVARNIDTFAFCILTSNKRGVAAFSSDDRRMIVVSCPESHRDVRFYDRIGDWFENKGPAKLLRWLLDYDLKGWVPPKRAPMTPEKYMAYMESLSPVERLAEETKTADDNVVAMWVESAIQWARQAEVGNNPQTIKLAQEIMGSLGHVQIRPWYSPEEIAMIFPAISSQLHGSQSSRALPSGAISRELRDAGVRYLRCKDDPRGFRWKGMLRQYLILAQSDEWVEPITQKEFETYMKEFPSFQQIRKSGKKRA